MSDTAPTSPTETGYAKVNGLAMYYEVHAGPDAAAQPPLVLLHGGVLTIDLSFSAVLPELVRSRRVVAVELQAHGRTADIDRDITVQGLASDVVALLDELGIQQADLLGFSLGGLTALEVAVRHPERVGRLVLASAQYTQDGFHDDIRTADYSSARMPSQADFQQMADAYARIAPHPENFQQLLAKCTAAAQGALPWTADDLRALTAPTLVVIGDTDFVRIEHAAEMQRLIPGAELAVLPATTHMQLMQRASLLLPMLDTFFDAR